VKHLITPLDLRGCRDPHDTAIRDLLENDPVRADAFTQPTFSLRPLQRLDVAPLGIIRGFQFVNGARDAVPHYAREPFELRFPAPHDLRLGECHKIPFPDVRMTFFHPRLSAFIRGQYQGLIFPLGPGEKHIWPRMNADERG
jgi:hypothetical protein